MSLKHIKIRMISAHRLAMGHLALRYFWETGLADTFSKRPILYVLHTLDIP